MSVENMFHIHKSNVKMEKYDDHQNVKAGKIFNNNTMSCGIFEIETKGQKYPEKIKSNTVWFITVYINIICSMFKYTLIFIDFYCG